MKLDLGFIRELIMDEDSEDVDEGEPVGDETVLLERTRDKGKKRKVKVGRGLGVGELVERNESHKA